MTVMKTSFQRTYASKLQLPGLFYSVPLTHPWQATADPHPCLETPGHSQASLAQSLGGHCSFLLGPGGHKILFVPSENLFPQSCGSSVVKSHWPSKLNSLGVSVPLLELLQQCKNLLV